MRNLYQIESDKQLDMAWAKLDLNAKLFLTNAQYNDAVQEAFMATCRIVLGRPLNELGGAS